MRHYDPRDNWKKLVLESRRKLIKEEEESKNPKERGNDSVDVQIDKFFSNFESEAKMSKNESLNWRMITRRLLEAEGDEEEEGSEEEESEGAEEESEDSEEDAPEKLSVDDIDINSFAAAVARLVDNYDSLLEVRDTITRRAVNYLSKGYELEVVQKFKDVMGDQFDLGSDEGPSGLPDEKFQAPPANRAMGGGGGGGGGGI
jgi:hypothetical protein